MLYVIWANKEEEEEEEDTRDVHGNGKDRDAVLVPSDSRRNEQPWELEWNENGNKIDGNGN